MKWSFRLVKQVLSCSLQYVSELGAISHKLTAFMKIVRQVCKRLVTRAIWWNSLSRDIQSECPSLNVELLHRIDPEVIIFTKCPVLPTVVEVYALDLSVLSMFE